MKKLAGIWIAVALLVLSVGCAKENEDRKSSQNTDKGTEETQSSQTIEETNKSSENSDQDSTENKNLEEGFYKYRPVVGSKRVFKNGDLEMFTQKIIASNDEYVQVTVEIGGTSTVQIYKWTSGELTLVYEEPQAVNPEQNILDSFTPVKNPEVIYSVDENANWTLIGEKESVTVPYGEFTNVYVMQKITDEVVGEDTIYTRYFAPGVGFIKETFELTGEQGYKDEANLSSLD